MNKELDPLPTIFICNSSVKILSIGVFELTDEHKRVTICPCHRDSYGIRWRCNKTRCCIQEEFSGHSSQPPKGSRGVTLAQAKALYAETGKVVHIGSRKFLTYNLKNANNRVSNTSRCLCRHHHHHHHHHHHCNEDARASENR